MKYDEWVKVFENKKKDSLEIAINGLSELLSYPEFRKEYGWTGLDTIKIALKEAYKL